MEEVIQDTLAKSAVNFLKLPITEGKITVDSLDTLIAKLVELGITLGTKIMAALVVFIIGRWICRYIKRLISNILIKKEIESSLASFIKSTANVVLNFCLAIIIIGTLGIETSSFIALFGAAGVAVGMALSGTLQNFAGGVIILLMKTYRVGDFIEAQGYSGTVKEIQIFNTIICTVDNKLITIPNGMLATATSINYSKEAIRRVDWTFDIAYGDSYDKAKQVISSLLDEDSRILKSPQYFIAISALDSSAVKITVRAWTENANYWGVFFDINEKVYRTFMADTELHIPFNQLDVHLHNN